MTDFATAALREALHRLRRAQPDVFGASVHRFRVNTPLADADLQALELRHAIKLPADYRRFLVEIGNGGAGPYYGIFPLGSFDGSGDGLQPWGDFVGTLAEAFAYHEPWNDLTGRPDYALADDDEDEYERRMDAFAKRYWSGSVMNGAIPICHIGCALRVWLVVSGGEAGNVWYDYRADYRGVTPVLSRSGRHASFGVWYTEWLDEALRAIS